MLTMHYVALMKPNCGLADSYHIQSDRIDEHEDELRFFLAERLVHRLPTKAVHAVEQVAHAKAATERQRMYREELMGAKGTRSIRETGTAQAGKASGRREQAHEDRGHVIEGVSVIFES